jgi:hypothetical protein
MIDFTKLTPSQLQIAKKVAEEAARQGIDPNLALAVAHQESRFKQFNDDQSVLQGPETKYKERAMGVMQLMPSTAKGFKVDASNLDENIRGGVSVLKNNLLTFGNPVDALIAYNFGPGNAKKYFETRDVSLLPAETRNYVRTVNNMYPMQGAEGFTAPPRPDAQATEAERIAWDRKYGDTSTYKPPSMGGQGDTFSQLVAGGSGAVAGAAVPFMTGDVRNPFSAKEKTPNTTSLNYSRDLIDDPFRSLIGDPLTKTQMMHPQGQALEQARRDLYGALTTRREAGNTFDLDAEKYRAELDRQLQMQIEADRNADVTRRQFVDVGGKQAPVFRVQGSPIQPIDPVTGGVPLIDQVQHANPAGDTAASLARERGQQMTAHQLRLRGELGESRVNQLAQSGVAPLRYPELMVDQLGEHVTTGTGRVALSARTLAEMDREAQQAAAERAAFENSPEGRAQAVERHQQMLRQQEAERLRQLAENQEFARRQAEANAARANATASTAGVRKAETNLYEHMLGEGRHIADNAEPINKAEILLRDTRTGMPSNRSLVANRLARTAPIPTGAVSGAGGALMGLEGYERARQGDTAGATIAGAGALSGALGTIPRTVPKLGGLAGLLSSLGILYGLDQARAADPYKQTPNVPDWYKEQFRQR